MQTTLSPRQLIGCVLLTLPAWSACAQASLERRGPWVQEASWELVPQPRFSERHEGPGFTLAPTTRLDWSPDAGGEAEEEALRLASYLQAGSGWQLRRAFGGEAESVLHFALDESLAQRLGEEGYRLEFSERLLSVRAGSAAGLFYGAQTLRQMMAPELAGESPSADLIGHRFAAGVIEDAPRFRWRGMHLDVGRHMYSVEDIEGFLESMAFYKFNVFHWHLTEDQGWRIEIKRFPLLTEVGGFRKSTPMAGDRNRPDGVPYGGFYTQEEIRRVVAFAKDLKIDVMPEIELPGHSLAAITAYPELGNPEFVEDLEVGTRWGVHPNILSPKESTLRFYEQVFDEVLELFPFRFIHIGGDEAPKGQWENSPSAQARMKELGLADEHALQAWFVAHFERYLSERGRRLVGWDEIQEGGLPSGATMMVWRGWHYGVEAARKGHDIIMAPTSHTYFDYYQANPEFEPEAIGGLLSLERVYSFEPVPEELDAEQARHVLGGQGQLWSEYFPTWPHVEYMAFPRMLALSEVLWSPAEARSWEGFQVRLPRQLRHLDARGVHYRIPVPVPDVDVVLFEESAAFEQPGMLAASRSEGGAGLVYTTDGSAPDADSARLPEGFRVTESSSLRVALRQPSGRVSHAARIEYVRLDAEQHGLHASRLEPGLVREDFFGVQARQLPDFEELLREAGEPESPWTLGEPRGVPAVALDELESMDRFASRFSGWIRLEQAGTYSFELGSDDGSRLAIAGVTVVDLDGLHGHITKRGRIQLPAGTWSFEVGYFEAGGAESLQLEVEGPGAWSFWREPLR